MKLSVQFRVMSYMAVAVALFGPIPAVADGQTGLYSTAAERENWRAQLSQESLTTPTFSFHPTGQLTGLAGTFPIAESSPEAIKQWLLQHGTMFGIETGETLVYTNSSPFFELQHTGEGTYDDVESGTTYRFAVKFGEIQFVGRDIVAILRNDRPAIRGVFNGHLPALFGYGPYVTMAEGDAWTIAESYSGGPLIRLEAMQTWFDLDWATVDTPGKKEVFWILKGETPEGRVRLFGVRNRDQSVPFSTSGITAFSVPQDHRGYIKLFSPQKPDSRLYWTNTNPTSANVCSGLSLDCTDPAYSDSLTSRQSWPSLVDIWYERSQPGGNPPLRWQWPWSGLNKSPFTNRNRSLTIVLSHAGGDCSPYPTPCSTTQTFWFGPGDASNGIYGHEYGHRIVDELKATDEGNTSTGKLTEAMCDLFGMLTDDFHLQRQYPCSPMGCVHPVPRTGFRIDAPSSNQVVDWTINTADCKLGLRATLGYAFYDAFTHTANFTIPETRDAAFNVWQAAILRAYSVAPMLLPKAEDLYSAAVSQLPSQPWAVFPSPGPAVNLQQALAATTCFQNP